ncbi:hypothetical protein ACG94X_06660 [Acinetobacter sp. ULE_I010]|uniref:hypothetical protein n=1 Tax=Acinetobacter sp. ULE_I010 TaxID=3373065 RepID=UPI003AF80BCB
MNATTLGMWRLSNSFAVGASILYDGLKGAITSSVLITPNASQVAKVLKGGGADFALTLAVEQLLGAVDWVLDPANNQIRYKVNPDEIDLISVYRSSKTGIVYDHINQLCQADYKFYFPYYTLTGCRIHPMNYGLVEVLVGEGGNTYNNYVVGFKILRNEPIELEEKTLSLETVAQKVIKNAENNNLDAQFAVLATATNILLEAEKDEAKAKPIEEELERNSKKCPNGQSRNAYGQCFICGSSALEQQMANDVQIAKSAHIGLGACKVTHTIEELTPRYNNYVREAVARDKLNACYDIPHQTHLNQAKEAWRQAQEVCVKYMAVK